MERHFYDPVAPELSVPLENRLWLTPRTLESIVERIAHTHIDITYGGLGQDGHIAYNQARRHPYSQISLDELRQKMREKGYLRDEDESEAE